MSPGIYTAADEHLLDSCCEQVALQLPVTALEVGSPVTTGSMRQQVASPWVRIMSDCASKIATLGAQLGLNPAARQSLQAPSNDLDDNPFLS
jgi:P27 family predicted phage terminase small subunit